MPDPVRPTSVVLRTDLHPLPPAVPAAAPLRLELPAWLMLDNPDKSGKDSLPPTLLRGLPMPMQDSARNAPATQPPMDMSGVIENRRVPFSLSSRLVLPLQAGDPLANPMVGATAVVAPKSLSIGHLSLGQLNINVAGIAVGFMVGGVLAQDGIHFTLGAFGNFPTLGSGYAGWKL